MKIVFLVINYMPHQLISIKSLIEYYNAEVHSFNYKDDQTIPKKIDGLFTYKFKDYSKNELLRIVLGIEPEIVVVAGWFLKEYVWLAKKIRSKINVPVVTVSDTQWRGNFRQYINCLLSPFYLKKAFTHIWVAGIYQFEYAQKLGFHKNEIIFNALSCDIKLFNSVNLEIKKNKYPKNFLFIGRFIELKGIEYLINAWYQITDKKGWTLTMVGEGPLKEKLIKYDDIIIKDFMDQNSLISEMQNAGCFIISSIFESWALVIHEAAAAGLPIIATEICGASAHFVINGFNGYRIKPNIESIFNTLMKVISLSNEELLEFGKNSRKLAQLITPELGAAQLLSLIKKVDYKTSILE